MVNSSFRRSIFNKKNGKYETSNVLHGRGEGGVCTHLNAVDHLVQPRRGHRTYPNEPNGENSRFCGRPNSYFVDAGDQTRRTKCPISSLPCPFMMWRNRFRYSHSSHLYHFFRSQKGSSYRNNSKRSVSQVSPFLRHLISLVPEV